MKMEIGLRMDREIQPEVGHYISPGSYGFDVSGRELRFDFMTSEGYIQDDDRRKIHFIMSDLDVGSFPEAKQLFDEQFYKTISGVTEIFVFTGEEDEPEINLESVEFIAFYDDRWSKKEIKIPQHYINDLNKRIAAERAVA